MASSFSFRVDEESKEVGKKKAERHATYLGSVMKALMILWIDGFIDIPALLELREQKERTGNVEGVEDFSGGGATAVA